MVDLDLLDAVDEIRRLWDLYEPWAVPVAANGDNGDVGDHEGF